MADHEHNVPELDSAFVRSQFPAFAEPTLQGWAFFENAGGSYPCLQVVDRLSEYYRRLKVQPYGSYPASTEAGAWMDESYRALAGALNVAVDEVRLGPSTSQNTYVLANALRPTLGPGHEIIVSNQDHEANAGSWRRLADTGVRITEWPVDPTTGSLDLDTLDVLLNPRVAMVAFPHASNVVGEINDVAAIAALAHANGALCVVDGVSYAPHGLPDVAALGADIYLFSLYKTWGPHLGVMTVRSSVADGLANQGHWFNAERPRARFSPAGPDHAQVAAAAGVVHYLDAVHDQHFSPIEEPAERARRVHDLFRAHEARLADPLLAFVADRIDLRLLGPADPVRRAPTVAVEVLDRPMGSVVERLVERKLMVGAGDFYAVRPLEAMKVAVDPGVLRMSLVHYNTADEVDRLIDGLAAALDA